ncbi:MAG: LTA synthase family protein [Bacteroidales bacterium]|jgi:phosphoglycerol transferase MdoB-like AlkP superfamily enzyme|nr:LTA synthase family protein [Bacteroidales bacterium]
MKKRLIAIFFYSLFWLLFFFSARVFFIVTHYEEASQFPLGPLVATFWHGIKLDLSATGYIFLIPMLLIIPDVYFNGNWCRPFLKWYTYIIIVISSGIVVSDTLLYKYWGFRMDYTPLLYLKTPKEAAASVTILQLAGVFAGFAIFSTLFIVLYRKYIDRFFEGFTRVRLWIPAMLFFMLLSGSLIIPIRGGVGVAPINAGTVYFSKDLFINHTAINVVWNVGSSVINQKPTKNPYVFGDPDEAEKIILTLTEGHGIPVRIINNNRPNIIFIVLESFGNALIGPFGGDSLTTPNLNRYIKEGVVFSDFYASGNRTDKAMPAILNGYPAQPANSIIKEPEKTQSLPGIIKTLNALGYTSSFWYGGEINFANFNSFIINSGFSQIITMDDFSPELKYSSWGIPDNLLFKTLMDSLKKIREPFLKVVLTLSSHEPFDVPMEPVFEGNDDMTKFRNSIYYSDKSLGEFLDWAKGTEWWGNTLLILVADHCRRNSNEVLVYDEEIFRIPMVWLGGALTVKDVKVEKTGSQVDIPLTILHQLDLEGNFPFSKDLLSEGSASFAFYTFNEGFGFITDSSKYIYDHKLGNAVVEEGMHPEYAEKCGKAYLQVLFDDFLNR